MTDTKTMPECWVVVLDGQIIGTNDEPCHLGGVDAVRYVPATNVEALESDLRTHRDLLVRHLAEIERLRGEVEALKADAERYKWLRDKSDAVYLREGPDNHGWLPSDSEEIDAAADAARSK